MGKRKLAFVIALLYVGIGTAYGLYYYATLGFPVFIFYFFAPVSLMPAILSSGESVNYGLIAIVQAVTFFLTWLLLWVALWIGDKLFKGFGLAGVGRSNS